MGVRPEWYEFRVGKPSVDEDCFSADCCRFSHVYHIAHLREAIRILEDGHIRSGLVYDESRLNKKRACVSWVSPNTWCHGSIYGHVRFTYDWQELIAGRSIYWVEQRRTNRQRIVRFLISDDAPGEDLLLYDPCCRNGPLFCESESKQWYYNGEITNEYMVLADLPVADCVRIDFCKHHYSICKTRFGTCSEKGMRAREVGAIVLGHLIGAGMKKCARKFECETAPGFVDRSVQEALSTLCKRLAAAHSGRKGLGVPNGAAKSLVASMCAAVSSGQEQRLRNLAGLFPSSCSIKETFWKCMEQFFKGLSLGSDEPIPQP
jgi:hypothetical protein